MHLIRSGLAALLFASVSYLHAEPGTRESARDLALDRVDPVGVGAAHLRSRSSASADLAGFAALLGDRIDSPGVVNGPGSDGAEGDRFATAIALDGDTAALGAPFDDVGSATDQGSVYVYQASEGGGWQLGQKLVASDGAPFGRFGLYIAIEGDTLVVGASRTGSGVVYVFARDAVGGVWREVQRIESVAGSREAFGTSIALSAGLMVVGAEFASPVPGVTSGHGAAYVYERDSVTGLYRRTQALVADDGRNWDRFGWRVAIDRSGQRLAVSSTTASHVRDGVDYRGGALYLFAREPSGWVQKHKLVAPDAQSFDLFGIAFTFDGALTGTDLLVGAAGREDARGAVYVFDANDLAAPRYKQTLSARTGGPGEYFGASLAVQDTRLVVGAPRAIGKIEPAVSKGAVYLFDRREAGGEALFANGFESRPSGAGTQSVDEWSGRVRIELPASGAADEFGWDVGLANGTMLVASPGDNVGTNYDQGSAAVLDALGSFRQILHAGIGRGDERFGAALAASGARALVGVPLADGPDGPNTGRVYSLAQVAGEWMIDGTVEPDSPMPMGYFGSAIAMVGDTALIGAPGVDNERGETYVFQHDGTAWRQSAILEGDGAAHDWFGLSVALCGDTAVVGAPAKDLVAAPHGLQEDRGAAYAYRRSADGSWQRAAVLQDDNLADEDVFDLTYFGWSVACAGDWIYVAAGADYQTLPDPRAPDAFFEYFGSAHVYRQELGAWTYQGRWVPPEPTDGPARNLTGAIVSWPMRFWGLDELLPRSVDIVATPNGFAIGAPWDNIFSETGQEQGGRVWTVAQSNAPVKDWASVALVRPPELRAVDDQFGATLAAHDDVLMTASLCTRSGLPGAIQRYRQDASGAWVAGELIEPGSGVRSCALGWSIGATPAGVLLGDPFHTPADAGIFSNSTGAIYPAR